MKYPTSSLSRRSTAPALGLILGMICMTVSGCALWIDKEKFPSGYVRVIHTEQHCKDVDRSVATQFPNAERIASADWGIGRLGPSRANWEILARQLAAELDADIALVRPCDGEGSFAYAQIEVWRTRGFKPNPQEEYHSESDTLLAPSQSTYGSRLKDIFECLEQASVTSGPISPDNKKSLGHVDATEYFSSGRYFPGYARIDKYFRPARTGDLKLSMIYSDRERAAWAAVLYRELPSDEKHRFAERYLICLLDRGYGLRPGGSSNKSFKATALHATP